MVSFLKGKNIYKLSMKTVFRGGVENRRDVHNKNSLSSTLKEFLKCSSVSQNP